VETAPGTDEQDQQNPTGNDDPGTPPHPGPQRCRHPPDQLPRVQASGELREADGQLTAAALDHAGDCGGVLAGQGGLPGRQFQPPGGVLAGDDDAVAGVGGDLGIAGARTAAAHEFTADPVQVGLDFLRIHVGVHS